MGLNQHGSVKTFTAAKVALLGYANAHRPRNGRAARFVAVPGRDRCRLRFVDGGGAA